MPTGIVKWFNGRKGYGFIEPEDGGNDVFVHVTALKDSGIKFLNEGDKVSYELTENRGRMAAGNLSLDGESSSDSDEAPSDEVEEAAEEEAAEEEAAEEEAPAEEVSSDDVDYSSMTVAELKDLLKAAGKPVSGKKAELIERLQE